MGDCERVFPGRGGGLKEEGTGQKILEKAGRVAYNRQETQTMTVLAIGAVTRNHQKAGRI